MQRHRGHVVKVTDGDTLKVRIRGVGIRDVRIAVLAPVGSRVVLTSDSTQADRDRYGRWLRYVARAGRDVGRAQVHAGLATTYVYRNDPFVRAGKYLRAEARAERAGRGSWSRCWS